MTMKSAVTGPFFILLLFNSITSGLGSVVKRTYSYIHSPYTWKNAQTYCRSHHIDLATTFTQSDENLMTMTNYHAWIGLHKVTPPIQIFNRSTSWIWSNNAYSYFSVWGYNEPHSSEACATVYYTHKKFYGHNCGATFFFICHKQHSQHYEYSFVPLMKTWHDAQVHCKTFYDDLATFDDYSDLITAVTGRDFPVWTGLYKDGVSWQWSYGSSDHQNWNSDQPGNNGNCAFISSSGKKLATHDCSTLFPFICFRDNLLLIKENKTWVEAMEHCRAIHYELISVQPGQDHDYVTTKIMQADTEEVWTGLRFLAGEWLFVNGVSMAYSDLNLCPTTEQRCGAIAKNNTGSMAAIDCTEEMNFLCYR